MPVDRQKLLRFQVLNECFRNRHRDYTMEDLVRKCNEALDQKLDMPGVSKRTIQNDIKELELPPYSIELDEDLRIGHKRVYRYTNTSFSLKLFEFTDEERNRLEQAISVLDNLEGNPQYDWMRFCLKQIVSDSFTQESKSLVSFQNNPDLSGIAFFNEALAAIANKQPLKIVYKPYPRKEGDTIIEIKEYCVKFYPYHLKQYNDRWFLIGCEHGLTRISNLALDRIIKMESVFVPFIDTDLDFDEYFDDVVGVSVRDKIENVLLKVDLLRYPYIQSKPLHWSQTEVKDMRTLTHVYIKLKVAVNNELVSRILSYGKDIEVLEPDVLRHDIASNVATMNDFYKQ